MMSVHDHTLNCWVRTAKSYMVGTVYSTAQGTVGTVRCTSEPVGMFLGVDGVRAIFENVDLIFKFDYWVFPKGIANLKVGYFEGP